MLQTQVVRTVKQRFSSSFVSLMERRFSKQRGTKCCCHKLIVMWQGRGQRLWILDERCLFDLSWFVPPQYFLNDTNYCFVFFQQIARTVDEFFEWDSSKSFRRLTIFSERIARTVQTDANVFEWIARAVQTDANFFERIARTVRTADDFFWTDSSSCSNGC